MLEVNGCFKFAQRDNWEHGCDPKGGVNFDMPLQARASDINTLVQKINDQLWCQYVVIGACDEPDRIDFSRMENDNGDRVDEGDAEWKLWKQGIGPDLWDATYTVSVEVVERKPAVLTEKEYKL